MKIKQLGEKTKIYLEINKTTQNSFQEIGIEPIEAIKKFFSYVRDTKKSPFKISENKIDNSIIKKVEKKSQTF